MRSLEWFVQERDKNGHGKEDRGEMSEMEASVAMTEYSEDIFKRHDKRRKNGVRPGRSGSDCKTFPIHFNGSLLDLIYYSHYSVHSVHMYCIYRLNSFSEFCL